MGVRVTLTKPQYFTNRKKFGSKDPLTDKEVLAYLNTSMGLKEEIVSFSVLETEIQYPAIPKKRKKNNVYMGNTRERKEQGNSIQNKKQI